MGLALAAPRLVARTSPLNCPAIFLCFLFEKKKQRLVTENENGTEVTNASQITYAKQCFSLFGGCSIFAQRKEQNSAPFVRTQTKRTFELALVYLMY